MQEPEDSTEKLACSRRCEGETINACSLRRLVVIFTADSNAGSSLLISEALKTNTKRQDRRSGRWTSCTTKSQLIYYDGSG